MNEHREELEKILHEAEQKVLNGDFVVDALSKKERGYIDIIVEKSEQARGLQAVLVTLLTHKVLVPTQDIRYHEANLPNGFAGRTIDTAEITPFLCDHDFPSPVRGNSGWLTRAFEQRRPYTLDYPANISPKIVKEPFLMLINNIETKDASPREYLLYYFIKAILKRDSSQIDLVKPSNLSIAQIVKVLTEHFSYNYSGRGQGASRLPTLAIQAAYMCMMDEVSRYKEKTLCPLSSHNSADTNSGQIGDVQVNSSDQTPFEGVEVKHLIEITPDLVRVAYDKFKIYQTKRYYLLTTADMRSADWTGINNEINRIATVHGCQVIVNGVYNSIKYYLRLLEEPAQFIDYYVENMKKDETIKYEQKEAWNTIIANLSL